MQKKVQHLSCFYYPKRHKVLDICASLLANRLSPTNSAIASAASVKKLTTSSNKNNDDL